MNILVLNCGSSSLKFKLIAAAPATTDDGQGGDETVLARGLIERIGGQALVDLRVADDRARRDVLPLRDHRAAIDHLLRWLVSDATESLPLFDLSDIHAVGHRVVHGGERFRAPVPIDASVIDEIEDCVELAPLHNPANLKGIDACAEVLGAQVPQVAVFDTAFHAQMPESSFIYGIPYQYYRRHGVRRYGFHGTSHQYLTQRYAALSGLPESQVNIITLHLGNGCSACAVRGGRSYLTSMGFTPLEGLLMGTRCGDIDPSLIHFLLLKEGLSIDEVDGVLNRHSGLLGVSGLTSDMRELLDEYRENKDRRVGLAIEMFCRAVVRYVGGYFADMGGADAVVFSGGIGENSAEVRAQICKRLAALGMRLDEAANQNMNGHGRITFDDSTLAGWVIPTDEELLIARETRRTVAALRSSGPR